jgi:hypothetical protein
MGSIYSMQKRADGWVISVGDSELLTCSRRTTAMRVIHHAVHDLDFVRDSAAQAFVDSDDEPPDGPDRAVLHRDLGRARNRGR